MAPKGQAQHLTPVQPKTSGILAEDSLNVFILLRVPFAAPWWNVKESRPGMVTGPESQTVGSDLSRAALTVRSLEFAVRSLVSAESLRYHYISAASSFERETVLSGLQVRVCTQVVGPRFPRLDCRGTHCPLELMEQLWEALPIAAMGKVSPASEHLLAEERGSSDWGTSPDWEGPQAASDHRSDSPKLIPVYPEAIGPILECSVCNIHP
ncbi:hypothetical protein ACRRTK_008006 [Alexandromys fortis]